MSHSRRAGGACRAARRGSGDRSVRGARGASLGRARRREYRPTRCSEGHISDRFACITAHSRGRKTRLGCSTAGGWGTTRSPKTKRRLGRSPACPRRGHRNTRGWPVCLFDVHVCVDEPVGDRVGEAGGAVRGLCGGWGGPSRGASGVSRARVEQFARCLGGCIQRRVSRGRRCAARGDPVEVSLVVDDEVGGPPQRRAAAVT
jgi:hypothetical protein